MHEPFPYPTHIFKYLESKIHFSGFWPRFGDLATQCAGPKSRSRSSAVHRSNYNFSSWHKRWKSTKENGLITSDGIDGSIPHRVCSARGHSVPLARYNCNPINIRYGADISFPGGAISLPDNEGEIGSVRVNRAKHTSFETPIQKLHTTFKVRTKMKIKHEKQSHEIENVHKSRSYLIISQSVSTVEYKARSCFPFCLCLLF